MKDIKTCKDCCLHKDNICLLTNTQKTDNDYCSNRQEHIFVCEKCNNPVIKDTYAIVNENTEHHIVCLNCISKLTTCYFCTKGQTCDFETNPSTLPKIVQKKIQQGPIVQIIQVKNPERIKITCQNGCPCWNTEDNACDKEINYCKNYECIWPSPVEEDEAKPEETETESEENGIDSETENT
jgi:hypothetical protein